MIALFAERLPLWKVVRSLLLDVGLCVGAMRAGELLGDGILDADALDDLIESAQRFVPAVVC